MMVRKSKNNTLKERKNKIFSKQTASIPVSNYIKNLISRTEVVGQYNSRFMYPNIQLRMQLK